jgi:hypothetical protein
MDKLLIKSLHKYTKQNTLCSLGLVDSLAHASLFVLFLLALPLRQTLGQERPIHGVVLRRSRAHLIIINAVRSRSMQAKRDARK